MGRRGSDEEGKITPVELVASQLIIISRDNEHEALPANLMKTLRVLLSTSQVISNYESLYSKEAENTSRGRSVANRIMESRPIEPRRVIHFIGDSINSPRDKTVTATRRLTRASGNV